jgi:hypothetical protein
MMKAKEFINQGLHSSKSCSNDPSSPSIPALNLSDAGGFRVGMPQMQPHET